MNVFASAGAAARSGNELSLLFVQARKMVSSESNIPAQTARERDVETGRALSNTIAGEDATSRKIKAGLQLAKVAVAIVKLVGAGISAATSSSQGDNLKDTKAVSDASKTAETAKTVGNVVGSAIAVGQQVIATINAIADMKKADKNRKTLDAESGSVDSATKGLDSRGKA